MLSSALFLADRGRQMIIAALCALAVSAQSRTVRLAAPLAVVTALLAAARWMRRSRCLSSPVRAAYYPLHEIGLLLLLFGPAVIYLAGSLLDRA